jgi:exonuclease VII large subunit
MRRGFAQLENEQNLVVQSIEQLQIGQNIKINLVDGYTTAKINEVNRRTKNEI